MEDIDTFKKFAEKRINEFNARKGEIDAIYQQHAENSPQNDEDELHEINQSIKNLEEKINAINKGSNYRGWESISAIFEKSAKDIDKALEKIEKNL